MFQSTTCSEIPRPAAAAYFNILLLCASDSDCFPVKSALRYFEQILRRQQICSEFLFFFFCLETLTAPCSHVLVAIWRLLAGSFWFVLFCHCSAFAGIPFIKVGSHLQKTWMGSWTWRVTGQFFMLLDACFGSQSRWEVHDLLLKTCFLTLGNTFCSFYSIVSHQFLRW